MEEESLALGSCHLALTHTLPSHKEKGEKGKLKKQCLDTCHPVFPKSVNPCTLCLGLTMATSGHREHGLLGNDV